MSTRYDLSYLFVKCKVPLGMVTMSSPSPNVNATSWKMETLASSSSTISYSPSLEDKTAGGKKESKKARKQERKKGMVKYSTFHRFLTLKKHQQSARTCSAPQLFLFLYLSSYLYMCVSTCVCTFKRRRVQSGNARRQTIQRLERKYAGSHFLFYGRGGGRGGG